MVVAAGRARGGGGLEPGRAVLQGWLLPAPTLPRRVATELGISAGLAGFARFYTSADMFFGIGLVLGLLAALPAVFVLAVAFVYVRQQRGQPVDITTGVSAYTVILIGLGALLVTLGVGEMLTALMAEIDGDYTYGTAGLGLDDVFDDLDGFGDLGTGERQERDTASGLALFVAGAAAIAVHIMLRGWLLGRARFDRGVEGAWDTLLAILAGVAAVALVAQMLSGTFGRAIADDDTTATGQTIAQMLAVLGLWVVYGYRALGHTGLLAARREGGPGGGEEI